MRVVVRNETAVLSFWSQPAAPATAPPTVSSAGPGHPSAASPPPVRVESSGEFLCIALDKHAAQLDAAGVGGPSVEQQQGSVEGRSKKNTMNSSSSGTGVCVTSFGFHPMHHTRAAMGLSDGTLYGIDLQVGQLFLLAHLYPSPGSASAAVDQRDEADTDPDGVGTVDRSAGITALCFAGSPLSHWLLCCTGSHQAYAVDWETGSVVQHWSLRSRHQRPVRQMRVDACAVSTLVLCHSADAISCWSLANSEPTEKQNKNGNNKEHNKMRRIGTAEDGRKGPHVAHHRELSADQRFYRLQAYSPAMGALLGANGEKVGESQEQMPHQEQQETPLRRTTGSTLSPTRKDGADADSPSAPSVHNIHAAVLTSTGIITAERSYYLTRWKLPPPRTFASSSTGGNTKRAAPPLEHLCTVRLPFPFYSLTVAGGYIVIMEEEEEDGSEETCIHRRLAVLDGQTLEGLHQVFLPDQEEGEERRGKGRRGRCNSLYALQPSSSHTTSGRSSGGSGSPSVPQHVLVTASFSNGTAVLMELWSGACVMQWDMDVPDSTSRSSNTAGEEVVEEEGVQRLGYGCQRSQFVTGPSTFGAMVRKDEVRLVHLLSAVRSGDDSDSHVRAWARGPAPDDAHEPEHSRLLWNTPVGCRDALEGLTPGRSSSGGSVPRRPTAPTGLPSPPATPHSHQPLSPGVPPPLPAPLVASEYHQADGGGGRVVTFLAPEQQHNYQPALSPCKGTHPSSSLHSTPVQTQRKGDKGGVGARAGRRSSYHAAVLSIESVIAHRPPIALPPLPTPHPLSNPTAPSYLLSSSPGCQWVDASYLNTNLEATPSRKPSVIRSPSPSCGPRSAQQEQKKDKTRPKSNNNQHNTSNNHTQHHSRSNSSYTNNNHRNNSALAVVEEEFSSIWLSPSLTEFASRYTSTFQRLREHLKIYGCFPPSFRSSVWRVLLGLPDKPHTAPLFASLARKPLHHCVFAIMEAYPLPPSKSAIQTKMQEAISILAWHSPVFSILQCLPAIMYPFAHVMGDTQSLVEVLLVVFLNWGKEFFSFHPQPPPDVMGFMSQLLRREDQGLYQHLEAIGSPVEVWGWEVLQVLYSDALTASEWLQLMDHAFTTVPLWLFVFHVCFLKERGDALRRCRNSHDVLELLREGSLVGVRSDGFSLAKTIREAYRVYHSYPFPSERLPSSSSALLGGSDSPGARRVKVGGSGGPRREERDRLLIIPPSLSSPSVAVPYSYTFYESFFYAQEQEMSNSGGHITAAERLFQQHEEEEEEEEEEVEVEEYGAAHRHRVRHSRGHRADYHGTPASPRLHHSLYAHLLALQYPKHFLCDPVVLRERTQEIGLRAQRLRELQEAQYRRAVEEKQALMDAVERELGLQQSHQLSCSKREAMRMATESMLALNKTRQSIEAEFCQRRYPSGVSTSPSPPPLPTSAMSAVTPLDHLAWGEGWGLAGQPTSSPPPLSSSHCTALPRMLPTYSDPAVSVTAAPRYSPPPPFHYVHSTAGVRQVVEVPMSPV